MRRGRRLLSDPEYESLRHTFRVALRVLRERCVENRNDSGLALVEKHWKFIFPDEDILLPRERELADRRKGL